MSGIFDQIINYSPPLIVSGTVNYKGTWNASTNTPTLIDPPVASTKGDYYVVSTAGTQFTISFAVGDWIISNGAAWEKVDLTDAVSSVFGRTGAVVGVSTDYSAVGITNTAIGATSPSTGAFTTVSASGLTVNDNTTLGSSNSDTVNFNARVASDFNPSTDNTYDLGRTGHEWRDLHIDGTANIDSLVADSADINGGTIDGTAIGATTPSTVAATALTTTAGITVGAGADFFNGSVRISDNASSTAPAYFQSGEPGISGSNVILSNNYFGTSGGASGRKNSSVGASYIRLNVGAASASNTTLGFISASGTSTDVASFSSAGASITGALSVSGNATFSGGTNQRLFVNTQGASAPNRLAFQESTTNGSLALFGLPNGTSTTATIGVVDDSAYTNGIRVRLAVSGGTASLISDAFGTGTAQPLQIQAQGVVSGTFSSTGLAVTGALSATGAINSANAFVSTSAVTANAADRVTLDFGSATFGRVLAWGPNNSTAGQLDLGVLSANASVGSTSIARVSSTGVAVTGALSSTTGANFATSSGNVGMGTASPAYKLSVFASSVTGGIFVQDSDSSNASPVIRVQGNRLDNNSSQDFSGGLVLERLNSNGTTGLVSGNVLGTIYFGGNYNATPTFTYPASISAIADGNWSSTSTASTGLAFFTGATGQSLGVPNVSYGTERMRIDSTGNVGIGTASPGSKLDVNGELRIGNTVATAVAVASTHKVTIVIGGVTYYLLATNV